LKERGCGGDMVGRVLEEVGRGIFSVREVEEASIWEMISFRGGRLDKKSSTGEIVPKGEGLVFVKVGM